jgi:hypothetical protein
MNTPERHLLLSPGLTLPETVMSHLKELKYLISNWKNKEDLEHLHTEQTLILIRADQEVNPLILFGHRLLLVLDPEKKNLAISFPCLDFIHPHSPPLRWLRTLENCFQILTLESNVARRTKEVQELTRIGIALSAERNLDSLLNLIVRKAMEITSADAVTLYLVEKKH